mmetsp:Transcript_8621/g.7949  ORF Transcript_8621/g.7949 Transcript_8621/m.7949 type:complete len:84 (+) Transcript_8621:312-563(+)
MIQADELDEFIDQCHKDTKMLESLNIMDYSILVIVSRNPIRNRISFMEEKSDNPFVFYSKSGKFRFTFGIIDYLQVFNTQKFL